DTSFVYGRALAQTAGIAVMRLADAELLPYEFKNLAETVKKYTDEVKTLLSDEQAKARETAMALDEGVYTATSDPHEPTGAPKRDSVPPYLNFAPLDNAVDALTRAATRYEAALGRAKDRGDTVLAGSAMREVNAELIRVERALTDAKGLPGRPWFVHQLYAPGFYTGYGVKTMPSVREAIEQKQFGGIDDSMTRLGGAIGNAARVIESATAKLEVAR
ncbi:MAG TPA: transferrin receptor-like dimerization domain-containing protein, partial [Gemmatimonadaceae bacterium]|nr:transferrin receptor-like dimerization domain-containing protein [Gemmatimonadaceae bacterium]